MKDHEPIVVGGVYYFTNSQHRDKDPTEDGPVVIIEKVHMRREDSDSYTAGSWEWRVVHLKYGLENSNFKLKMQFSVISDELTPIKFD